MKLTNTLKALYGFLLMISGLLVFTYFANPESLGFLVNACKDETKYSICQTLSSGIDNNSLLFISMFFIVAVLLICALVSAWHIHRAVKASKTTTFTYEMNKRKSGLKRIEHNVYKYNEEYFAMAARSKFFKAGVVFASLLIVLVITSRFTADYEDEVQAIIAFEQMKMGVK